MTLAQKPPHTTELAQLVRAPENFLDPEQIADVSAGRRGFLAQALQVAAGASLLGITSGARAETTAEGPGDPAILNLPVWSTTLGQAVASMPYGLPSKFEANLVRRESPGLTRVPQASVAFAPLQGMFGIITPNGLHFERHHQGWQDVDPRQHRLMVHGLVSSPRVYTMDDLMRLPPVSRVHFIECGANTGMEWGNSAVPTVQYTHGMLSCCEFTGVPLSLLLDQCGIDRKRARFVLAEGADGSSMTRTIALERALDDVLVAYGMNGEMLRPENGYPLRLVVPGVQGVSWVKWLRRIKVGDEPFGTKDETVHYVDLMPDGRLRQYTSIQECKSVITTPSGGQTLVGRGYFNISGIAWSGRGKIRRVDVSTDGGRNWKPARLETPIHDKSLTRFNFDWNWSPSGATGQAPLILQSRAIDDTGYVQPQIRALRAVRGSRSLYHNNAIQSWQIDADGRVTNVQVG